MARILDLPLGSFGRFLTSGAFNTVATYLLYLGLLPVFSYRVSYTAAYASGIGLAYLMNRYLVFRRPGGRAGPLLVALIYGGQYLLSLLLVTAWVRWLKLPAELAPLFAVAVNVPLTYMLNRRVFSAVSPPVRQQHELPRRFELFRQWFQPIAIATLVGLPILSLVLNATAWVQFGFDLPFFDDWRGYDSGDIDSLELSYLFRPLNDTLTPIGFALDAVAQRVLNGNSVVYQLLSMLTVLGTLLLLQWNLLVVALGQRTRAAVCFVFTLLMLQPGSYWGRENMAFQQALPLVFMLAALWLGVRQPLREFWNLLLIFMLGLLSGFSYISGAFGALAAGGGMVLAVWLTRPDPSRPTLLRAGATLALAGAVASAFQVFYAILPSKGGTHIAGKSLAMPFEADFWFFYLGKLGRSLLLRPSFPTLSLAIVLLVCAVVVISVMLLIKTAREPSSRQDALLRTAALFGAVSAMVFTYLMLVAAGRANYRPLEVQNPADVFAYAFERFHFFWATLLWPWLVAVGFVLHDRFGGADPAKRTAWMLAGLVLPAAIALMIWGGALDHHRRHRDEAAFRRPAVECLMFQLQRGEGIHCEEFNLPDLTPAFIYARTIGASFVRHFPILPLEIGIDSPSPWFRLSRDPSKAQWRDTLPLVGSIYRPGPDPSLTINIGRVEAVASCVMLDVTTVIRVEKADIAKVYFRPLGQRDFTESSSTSVDLPGGPKLTTVRMRLENPLGFEGTLRFDPVASHQDFELLDLEVRCRLKSRYDTLVPFYAITDGTSPGQLDGLKAVGDVEGHYKAAKDSKVLFRTGHRQSMNSCRFLEVQAIYNVEKKDTGQLYFRPREASGFSEQNSLSLPVAPHPKPQLYSFVVESSSGFEDELRFDPVNAPQGLLFEDIKVRCLKRIDQHRLAR